MLKLYFFDGEKIADYFLDKKEVNIRDALMILSGNDTFDILYENVKRVLKLSEAGDSDAAQKYLDAKITVEKTAAALSLVKQEADSLHWHRHTNYNVQNAGCLVMKSNKEFS